MKLFISWSGNLSQQIAQVLHEWLPLVLNVRPFITSTDIEKGARWQHEISAELDQSNFGVVCLTRDNLQSQWISFECGALSKHLSGRVATLLFGIGHANVPSPMNMFQGTLFEYNEFRQLMTSINNCISTEQRKTEAQIDALFEVLWPRFSDQVRLLLEGQGREAQPEEDKPSVEAMLVEMLAMQRQQASVLSAHERLLESIAKQVVEQRSARAADTLLGSLFRDGFGQGVARRTVLTGVPEEDVLTPVDGARDGGG
jgi:hypothetical protein